MLDNHWTYAINFRRDFIEKQTLSGWGSDPLARPPYIFVCVYMFVCMYECIMYVQLIIKKHIHVYIYIYIYILVTYIYIYIYIYIYEVHTISFQIFFVWAFKIVVDCSKLRILFLYILWSIFMISASNEQLQLKPDCHSWWISKIQSDTLEERYAIKLCFKLGKNVSETYGMLRTAFRPSCMNRPSVFEWHMRFKEGRESVRDGERSGRNKEVNTPQLIGQSVRVRVTMLRF